jgi:hypothetical protein
MPYDAYQLSQPRRTTGAGFLKVFAPISAAAVLALAACGGGGGGAGVTPVSSPSPIGNPSPTATPSSTPTGSPSSTPGPTGAQVIVTPSNLAFQAAGSGAAQSVGVAQAQNAGGFTLTTANCGPVAGVSPASGAGPFTVTPLAAGTCTYVVAGSGGATAILTITVTTTSVGSQ